MKRFNVSAAVNGARSIAKGIIRSANAHRPEILAASGVCGYLASLFVMYKHAEPLREAIENKDIKKIAKEAAPIVVTTTLSTMAIIGSVHEGNRRYAAMSAAYTLTDAAFTEYKESAKEILGKKESKIDQNSAEKEIRNNPVDNSTIIDTGKGKTLFYERLNGRYFYSDINYIKSTVADMNQQEFVVDKKNVVRVRAFEEALGLEPSETSNTYAWHKDYGWIDVTMTFHKSAADGTPIIALTYENLGLIPKALNLDIFDFVQDENFIPVM